MKDIPMFTCEYGVASLILREIPYRREAHIILRSTTEPEALLAECVGFCRACGAERIDAAGDPYLETFPFLTDILRMQRPAEGLPETDAMLFPVLEEHVYHWRRLYNEKMANVPNAATMTEADGREMVKKGDGYFVHRDGVLIGIGRASEGVIDAVASVVRGGGRDTVLALASLLQEETVALQVASANEKAVRLYESLGFLKTATVSSWYLVFENGKNS